jgi:hypothetical protein
MNQKRNSDMKNETSLSPVMNGIFVYGVEMKDIR